MSVKRNRVITKLPLISALLYVAVTGLILLFSSTASAVSQQDKDSLIYLLQQDCGSCHGLTLQGGLGPALLKKNLKGKPKAYLEYIIKQGRPGTPMPPWGNILRDEEIAFLAEYLLSDRNILATYQNKMIGQPVVSQSNQKNSN